MKKIAAIDIGTNSMRLLLCECDESNLYNKRKYTQITRIGENVSKTKKISPEAKLRNIEALISFKKLAEEYKAEQIIAIATSAVRDAQNKAEFLEEAKQKTGIYINVISGEEEAELGITGVLRGYDKSENNLLVIDIGGGSTELILYEGREKLQHRVSIDAGAVRMTESCINNNPLSKQDKQSLEMLVEAKFKEQIDFLKTKKIHQAIAIGGTATTLAAIFHKLGIYQTEIIHNTIIQYDYVQSCFNELSAMDLSERCQVEGLQKERADVIVSGIYILLHLIKSLALKQVTVSDSDNLEGTIIKKLKII